MREHKDWVQDPRRNAKLVGAHHMAVGDGLEPDTPEYFAHVERQLGIRSGGGSSRGSGNERASMGGAVKINPGDFNSHVTDDGKVYLSENEKRIAQDGTLVHNFGPNKGKPIGVVEMARRKREQIKMGLHNRI
jgi:hypothetical protein